MTSAKEGEARVGRRSGAAGVATTREGVPPSLAVLLDDARDAGLLAGDRTEHVSFRAPPALVEAARRQTGIESTTELGILALAALAQPDPVAAFLKRTRGRLGKSHTLEY